MLKNVMLERDMEEYLLKNDYDVVDEGCINSSKVIEEALYLGYNSYLLENEIYGEYHDTYVFIRE